MGPVAAVVATEALQTGELTLLVAANSSGYFGVHHTGPASLSPIRRRCGAVASTRFWAALPPPRRRRCASRDRRRGGRWRGSGLQC